LFQRRDFLSMPKYFFHVYHNRTELDFVGEELPDKQRCLARSDQSLDGKLQPAREWRMDVMDEFENPLYVLHINAEKPK
jgi:hypothetical protein